MQHALEKKSTSKGVEALFVEETKGNLIPYFIKSAKAKNGNESLVLLDGIASKEAAHRFIRKDVWLYAIIKLAISKRNQPASYI